MTGANELFEGVVLGCNAVVYMAMQLAQTGRDFEFIAAAQESRPEVPREIVQVSAELRDKPVGFLREALTKIQVVMNDLGDHLNNMDGVGEEDEKATEHAFERVRQLLKE